MVRYGQFCPVAQALEILGERWTLLLVRELFAGSSRFTDLQRGVPLMSRSMLAQRLAALCDAGVVERFDGGYRLREAGRELGPLVMKLGTWGARWARRKLSSAEIDVGLLMWDIRRRIRRATIPAQPLLVELAFRGARRGHERFFLHFQGGDVELCLTNPGLEVGLRLGTTPRTMAEVWLGELAFGAAVRSGAIQFEGPSRLVHSFASWLRLSAFATVRDATRSGRSGGPQNPSRAGGARRGARR